MSNIFSGTFKKLYNSTTEAIHAMKEPLVLNKNKRAVDSAIDSATDAEINAKEALEKELQVVSKGEVINVNNVLKHIQDIENARNTIEVLEELKNNFFAEEKN